MCSGIELEVLIITHFKPLTDEVKFLGGGGGEEGGRLGPKYARMCVSKNDGHESFFNFKGVN